MKIYEGKAKIIFSHVSDPDLVIQHFKDDITCNNNQTRDILSGKGVINNHISEFFMRKIGQIGIPTHLVKLLNMREQLIKKVEVIPLEVVIRNVISGSLSRRLGLQEGVGLSSPIIEFYLKDDALGDPMLCEGHFQLFKWAESLRIEQIKMMASRVNDFLAGMLAAVDIILVDLKLEFGIYRGSIIIIDEISPDSCRLWDSATKEKMDKDRFRQGLGMVVEHYRKVASRLGIVVDS